jgi:hypothetical protein
MAAVWQINVINAVLVPASPSPPPPRAPAPPVPKVLAQLLSGSSTFAAAVRASSSLASAVSSSPFRGTILVPTDQVGGGWPAASSPVVRLARGLSAATSIFYFIYLFVYICPAGELVLMCG